MTKTEPASFDDILNSRPPEARHLLALLQALPSRYRHLPEPAVRAVAERLSLPLARVFAVAGFYRSLSLKPKGEKTIQVCCGTACHLRGAPDLVKALEERLNLKLGETSSDGRHTLEGVNCVGACALAPVVMVGEAVYGHLTPGALPPDQDLALDPGSGGRSTGAA
jgi:NADH-quinone oxidoreductase subunit E